MIPLTAGLWVVFGALAGGTHTLALQPSILKASAFAPLTGLLRIAVVGGVLTLAATLGFLWLAFTGWAFGFAVTLFIILTRKK